MLAGCQRSDAFDADDFHFFSECFAGFDVIHDQAITRFEIAAFAAVIDHEFRVGFFDHEVGLRLIGRRFLCHACGFQKPAPDRLHGRFSVE